MIELLRTKLFIPRPRKKQVLRQHLVDRLNRGLDEKLTLIAAPAGFGKSALLSEWIPHSPRCVTWFSLDEGDNDPAQFWAYFISSLQGLRVDLGDGALTLLQSPQALPIPSILTALINDLSAFQDSFAIVLDDYHVIENQAVHDALAYLIEHSPPNMHLVLTTRIDPPLPLARLRAYDQLVELRANDLRFKGVETAAFLNQTMGLNLSAEEVAALEARTEGWIAGLQIAALSMQGREDVSGFIRAFSGSHRHILGYLADEVLHQQPKDTLTFLLQTSVLERLCSALCDAVTGDSGGQEILENLEHSNLFISPLDHEGVWYRYHHLFAEVLRVRLQQAHPDLVPELHRRAREWLEQNGLMDEAINHAIAGGDADQAARLVERLVGIKWQAGEIKTLQGWLSAVPAESWHSYPRLWLVQAWVAMTVGDFVTGDTNLKAAEAAIASLDPETARRLRPEVDAFRASYASLVQDPGAIELAKKALLELPADYWMRGMLVVFLGAAYYSAGDLEAALAALEQAPGSTPSAPGTQLHQVHLLAFSGTVHYAKGKLQDALILLNRAIELAEPGGVPIPYVGTLLAYMSIVPVLYEQDQLERARNVLTRCLELAVNFGSAEVEIYTLSHLAQICMAHEDVTGAANHYQRIDALLQKHTFSTSIMAHVDYHRFQLYLEQKNLAGAGAWVETYTAQPGLFNAYAFHRVALSQMLISAGDFDLALEKLSSLIQEAQDTGHGSLLIKALVLQSLANYACTNIEEAFISLESALSLAQKESFVRTFVDEGEAMRVLLQAYRSNIKERLRDGMDSELLRLLTYTDRLAAAFPRPAQVEKLQPETFREPLSERELDILRLIATGRSNQEIAEILVIAVSTVKSHINNLYGKLGTNRRTQAIAMARDLGLLGD